MKLSNKVLNLPINEDNNSKYGHFFINCFESTRLEVAQAVSKNIREKMKLEHSGRK